VSFTSEASALLGPQLLSVPGPNSAHHNQEIRLLHSKRSTILSEQLEILEEAEEYSKIEIAVELRTTPVSSEVSQNGRGGGHVLIQSQKKTVQVSNRYRFNPNSQILLITSYGVPKWTVDAWTGFIRRRLRTSPDIRNVSQYGGFDIQGTLESVLSKYAGKTVVALDHDAFKFCDKHTRTILNFVRPGLAWSLSRHGTEFLFAHNRRRETGKTADRLLELAFSPALGRSPTMARADGHIFDHTRDFINHLQSDRETCYECGQPEVSFFVNCHHSKVAKKGRRIAKVLCKRFSLDRFIVTDSSSAHGLDIIQCHSHGQGFRIASFRAPNNCQRDGGRPCMSKVEAFALVSSLPLNTRLDILGQSESSSNSNVDHERDFVRLVAKYSIMFELHEQVQCLTSQKLWSDTPFSFKERNFKTHSLHGASSDKIATTLDHNLMGPSITRGENRVFSPTAHEILSSMVASARCQTMRQLLLKWFSPFKRTRSHVRRGLLAEIRYRIASTNQASGEETKKYFKAFKKTVPQKLIHKDHLAQLNGKLQSLTMQKDLTARELFNDIDEVFPKSLYMPPE
jgi:hypothetical protein